MNGRVLDSGRILERKRQGWSNMAIAHEMGVPTQSITQSMREDRDWDVDPGLRRRWEAKLPAMREALRAEIAK